VLIEVGLSAFAPRFASNGRIVNGVAVLGTAAAGAAVVWLTSLQTAMTRARELNWRIRQEHFTPESQRILGPPIRRKLRLVWAFYAVVGAAWLMMIITLGLL
jgi:hypothetical protein